jgi:hypothetical protein
MAMLVIVAPPCRSEATVKMIGKARMIMGFYVPSITETASLSDIQVTLNFWVKDFMTEEARKIGIEITDSRAILFDSMTDMKEAAHRGELDIVIAPPLLLALNFKRDELKDGFTGMLEGGRPDDMMLIARADKQLNSVADLQGKRISIPENDEFAAIYLDSLFLQQYRRPVQRVVANLEKQNKASRIVLDVYFNRVDAGVVYRNAFEVMAELNPDVGRKLVDLDYYPMKSRNFSYFLRSYPFSQEVSDMAVNTFKSSVRGKQIMEVFKAPELTRCSVAELDAYEQFYRRYQTLKEQVK